MSLAQSKGALSILPTDGGGNRVLVVDDDLSHRTMLVRLLRKANYEIGSAMSNEEARSQLDGSTYGLVVADLHMFAEDGIELVRHVSDRCPDTYCVVVSGFVGEADVDRVRQAGAFELMRKPVDRTLFLEMVQRAFEHRAGSVAERRHRAL